MSLFEQKKSEEYLESVGFEFFISSADGCTSIYVYYMNGKPILYKSVVDGVIVDGNVLESVGL